MNASAEVTCLFVKSNKCEHVFKMKPIVYLTHLSLITFEDFLEDFQKNCCITLADDLDPNDEAMDGEPNWDDEAGIVAKLTCIGITGIEDPVRQEVSMTRRC